MSLRLIIFCSVYPSAFTHINILVVLCFFSWFLVDVHDRLHFHSTAATVTLLDGLLGRANSQN